MKWSELGKRNIQGIKVYWSWFFFLRFHTNSLVPGTSYIGRALPNKYFSGFMFESILNLFSRYVSTVGSKRRYHSSRVCVDVAGRDSCHCVQCFYTGVAKTSISNFRRVGTAFSGELPRARTVLLFGSYSGQIFPRRNLLTCRRK